jgi:UDP-N-acetylmuramoylalanine--D-glutamate ligase
MWDAVRKSFDLSKRGDVVLLSPACASFDMYKNFEHRGTEFKKLVNEL